MKTIYYFPIAIVIFTLALFEAPIGVIPDTNIGSNLVTVVTFLFGILAGFYIVVTTTDYNTFKSTVAEETAGWIRLYQKMLIYNRRQAKRLANLIDEYILRSFDVEIIEYVHLTRPEFANIEDFIRRLRQRNNLDSIFEKIHDTFDTIVTKRQMLTVLSTRTLSVFQWAVLHILSGLLILSLYGIRDGRLFSDVVAISISSAVVLVLILVRELDLFLWNEKTFGYDIYENVLVSIGKLPYFPDEAIAHHRVTVTESVYRVGVRLGKNAGLKKRQIKIIGLAQKKKRSRSRRRKN